MNRATSRIIAMIAVAIRNRAFERVCRRRSSAGPVQISSAATSAIRLAAVVLLRQSARAAARSARETSTSTSTPPPGARIVNA
jgi:hypothetical protein